MPDTRFIVAGNFIDGSGGGARKRIFFSVTEGRITAIGEAADLPSTTGAAVDDLSHCTVLPALVDCAVLLSRSPAIDTGLGLSGEENENAGNTALLKRHLNYCHSHGVLGVADGGDQSGVVARYLKESRPGGLVEIRTSGPACRSLQGDEDAFTAGRDFLRIGYSPDIEDDSLFSQMSQEELGRLVGTATRAGKKTVVVANGRKPVEEALAAGCHAIEQGYGMGEANLREIAARGGLWIPSVVRARNGLLGSGSGGDVCCRFSLRYVAPGKARPGVEAFWKKTLAEQLAQLRLARELGVSTAVGTGAGTAGILHGEAVAEELKLFLKAGYSLEEAVRSASENGARFFGFEHLGALGVGSKATFLLTRGGPQQVARKISYLEGIYVEGAPSSSYRKNPVKGG